MILNDLLSLRPTHIEQKLGDTWILLLPLSIISKLQSFRIPILKSNNIEELKGWFFAAKLSSTVMGISFDVSTDDSLLAAEITLKKLIVYLKKENLNNPFFIEAELDFNKIEKHPETIFYYLLQSYFTTFNLKINISKYKDQIENLNAIYKPIRDLELGFTLTIDSDSQEILKYIDDFTKVLRVFKIKPDYIKIKDNNPKVKLLIQEKLDIKFSEDLLIFNKFSDNIYLESDILRTKLKESIENQVFYSSRKFFEGFNLNNSLPKLLSNLYQLGDEL